MPLRTFIHSLIRLTSSARGMRRQVALRKGTGAAPSTPS
jgi:hypothetical protein